MGTNIKNADSGSEAGMTFGALRGVPAEGETSPFRIIYSFCKQPFARIRPFLFYLLPRIKEIAKNDKTAHFTTFTSQTLYKRN